MDRAELSIFSIEVDRTDVVPVKKVDRTDVVPVKKVDRTDVVPVKKVNRTDLRVDQVCIRGIEKHTENYLP